MAKNKTKTSAAQRDKINISIAKSLKKAGLISKQAKLHSGNFISKGVLRKVRAMTDLYELDYRAVKVPRKVAIAAKERGFQVIAGNKIVGPNSQTFRNRLRSGTLTGIKPVKGGYMEQVILPHTVMDMRGLIEQLELGVDSLKMSDENFAFKYNGNESYRSFPDTKTMLEYLRNYKGFNNINDSLNASDMENEFEALTLFRLHPATEYKNLRGPTQRRKDKQAKRVADIQAGNYVSKRRPRKSRLERAAEMDERGAARYLKRLADKDRRKREALAQNPAKLQEYRSKARARAQKSRNNKKA